MTVMIKTIRATEDDVPRLVPLFGEYRRFYRAEPDSAREQAFLAERMSREESVVFIAEDASGAAIGFTQLYPSFSSVSMAAIWILNDLYVDDAARGTGVGRALLERARDWAVETGAIRLELATEVTNDRAQGVYDTCGWVRNTTFYHYSLAIS